MEPLDYNVTSDLTRIVYLYPPNKEHDYCLFLYDGPRKEVKIGQSIWYEGEQYIVTAGPDKSCTGEKEVWYAVKVGEVYAVKVGEVYDFSEYKLKSKTFEQVKKFIAISFFCVLSIFMTAFTVKEILIPLFQYLKNVLSTYCN